VYKKLGLRKLTINYLSLIYFIDYNFLAINQFQKFHPSLKMYRKSVQHLPAHTPVCKIAQKKIYTAPLNQQWRYRPIYKIKQRHITIRQQLYIQLGVNIIILICSYMEQPQRIRDAAQSSFINVGPRAHHQRRNEEPDIHTHSNGYWG